MHLRALNSLFVSIFAACLFLGTEAQAVPVTLTFTGEVDGFSPELSAQFALGDILDGSYTFESSTAARVGSNSTFAVFDALLSLDLVLGTYSASSTGAPEIQVDNDPGAGNHDRYAVVARASDGLVGDSVNGNLLNGFIFRLDDSTDSVFSDALVLPTALNFSSFDSGFFFLFFANPQLETLSLVSGRITSVSEVPEPATMTLLLGGMALGLARRRQRSRN